MHAKIDWSLRMAEAAVELIDPAVDPKLFAVAKANLAGILLSGSQPSRGAVEAEDALRIFQDFASESLGHFALNALNQCRGVYAVLLWIKGCPDRALAIARAVMSDAAILNSPGFLAVSHLVASVHWWRSELPEIEPLLRRSAALLESFRFSAYRPSTQFYLGAMLTAKGDAEAGVALLETVQAQGGLATEVMASVELAKWRLAGGRVREALADLRRAEATSMKMANVLQTEIDRLTAEALAAMGESAEAQARLARAVESVRRREALGLELRVAISAVRVARRSGSDFVAVEALQAVYDRFTEGFGTLDARIARELLGVARVARRAPNGDPTG
jgi:tetratricopeptide (TPR) repeat protein